MNVAARFWRWYERTYVLNISIALGLFLLQIIHLIWLFGQVVWAKLFGVPLFELSGVWHWLIIAVDYTEIPALVSVALNVVASLILFQLIGVPGIAGNVNVVTKNLTITNWAGRQLLLVKGAFGSQSGIGYTLYYFGAANPVYCWVLGLFSLGQLLFSMHTFMDPNRTDDSEAFGWLVSEPGEKATGAESVPEPIDEDDSNIPF